MRIELDKGGSGPDGAGQKFDVRQTNSENGPVGVNYKCFEGSWDNVPNFSDMTPYKTGTTSYFDITVAGKAENFGVEYTGFVKITESGVYTFTTTSDDGSQLFIGSTRVVNNDGLHGMDTKKGDIELKKGMHPIRVAFFEKGGGEGLAVGASAPCS